MANELTEYCQALGMDFRSPLHLIIQKTIQNHLNFSRKLCPDDIKDTSSMFISEDGNAKGAEAFKDLWLFYGEYCFLVKDFKINDQIELISLRNTIMRCELQRQDYDFNVADGNSRLSLTCYLESGLILNMKATQINCDYLKDIYKKHIIPNLRHWVFITYWHHWPGFGTLKLSGKPVVGSPGVPFLWLAIARG